MTDKTNHQTNYTSSALAYIGDAIFELMVRKWVMNQASLKAGALHNRVIRLVNAKSQSDMIEGILPYFTPQELAIYKRGRNQSHLSAPKNTSPGQYSRATGLEAVFGYLYLNELNSRLTTLFELCMQHTGANYGE